MASLHKCKIFMPKNNDKICSCYTNWIIHLPNVDNDNFGIYIWKRSQEFQTIIRKTKRKSNISECVCIPIVRKHALISEGVLACALYALKIGSCLQLFKAIAIQ